MVILCVMCFAAMYYMKLKIGIYPISRSNSPLQSSPRRCPPAPPGSPSLCRCFKALCAEGLAAAPLRLLCSVHAQLLCRSAMSVHRRLKICGFERPGRVAAARRRGRGLVNSSLPSGAGFKGFGTNRDQIASALFIRQCTRMYYTLCTGFSAPLYRYAITLLILTA